MRFDAQGLFWEDAIKEPGKREITRNQPPIPDTGWQRPTHFPDLSAARVISIDCETYDPELPDNGPGWARGKGHIVGVSVGADGGGRWYFPMRHTVEADWNLPPEQVLAWLGQVLSNPSQPKVGANLYYDIGWLRHEGVIVRGELVDVQYGEALLDERAKVALDVLGLKYLKEGKDSSLLYRWCSDFYGGRVDESQRKNIYRTPPRLTGPYAESDADLPLRVAQVMYPLLVQEGLLDLFRMECDLIYLMVAMRFAGVDVDIPAAEKLREELHVRELAERQRLDHVAGYAVSINSAASLARAFDDLGLKYPRTAPTKKKPNGSPSFTKEFLESVEHPIGDHIREIRKLEKLRTTFVESYILSSHVNGKVYGQFHAMRGDSGGTRSGRFSSSNPNLQNLPSRDGELAPLVRGIFVPSAGHQGWRCYDYSQIEYRFLVHYALGPQSEEARAQWCADPTMDYHEFVREMIYIGTGVLLDRKPTKTINFGLIYGMGMPTLGRRLHLDKKQRTELFRAYHAGMPFIEPTMADAMEVAQRTGVMTTILGRKSRFDLWEQAGWRQEEEGGAVPYEQAIAKWSNIQRAYTHKALNRKLQGSAADLMKKAMHRCYMDGVFDETGVPCLTVHDELDFSDPGGKEPAFQEMQNILQTAIPLRVPVVADCAMGPNWGHTTDMIWSGSLWVPAKKS